MEFEQLLLIIHVLIALAIVGLILLQQGKGAEMGASFGAGSSQTVFGGAGGGNLLTRATAVLAALFFATSVALAITAKNQAASVGEVWVSLNANSLVGFGAAIEQNLSPWLWLEVIVPVLTLPAWLVLGLPGALVVWACRRKKRRPMFRNH